MSDPESPAVGSIGWLDLTVEAGEEVRDFYRKVVGWGAESVSMGDYDDFTMLTPGAGDPVGGICHARGGNAGLPAQWMIYIVVEDLDRSMADCRALGGDVIAGPRSMDGSRYCFIRDPAGAVAALYQPS